MSPAERSPAVIPVILQVPPLMIPSKGAPEAFVKTIPSTYTRTVPVVPDGTVPVRLVEASMIVDCITKLPAEAFAPTVTREEYPLSALPAPVAVA